MSRFIDLRYVGQSSELTIELPASLPPEQWVAETAKAFHAEHETRYGYRRDDDPVYVVSLRLKAQVPARSASFAELSKIVGNNNQHAATESAPRDVYFGGKVGTLQARILSREHLRDNPLQGPIVIEEFDTTIVIPPGWRASLDRYGSVILDRD